VLVDVGGYVGFQVNEAIEGIILEKSGDKCTLEVCLSECQDLVEVFSGQTEGQWPSFYEEATLTRKRCCGEPGVALETPPQRRKTPASRRYLGSAQGACQSLFHQT
jgi:hypothetical protein